MPKRLATLHVTSYRNRVSPVLRFLGGVLLTRYDNKDPLNTDSLSNEPACNRTDHGT